MKTNTRRRILEAACRLFAAGGYRNTTIAGICRAAEANIAAVNYYFGNKEHLYEAAWEHAEAAANEKYGIIDPGASPAQYLREHIRRIVLMIFDEGPGGCFPRLVRKDINMEGELIERLFTRFILPRIRRLEAAVSAILGLPLDSIEVHRAASHIHSMCVFLNIGSRARQRIFAGKTPDSAKVELLIRSLQEFAEGGIRRIANTLKKAGAGGGPGKPGHNR
ncbi:MAG: CerR family C-terminal domain-containing protein [PVC group bacterium]